MERKSVKDLVASVDDGRLARFIEETGATDPPKTQVRALLVEGDVEQGLDAVRGRDWTAEQIEALLFDAQLLGVLVLHSPSVSATPKRIANLWRWSGKDEHKAFVRPVLPGISDSYLDPDKKAAVRAAMVLPNWGEQRARAAVETLGSAAAVYAAILARDHKKFEAVPGVGKVLVNNAAEFLEKQVG